MSDWRWAAASCTGTSHRKLGTRRQDAYAVRELKNAFFCAAVSDGAGSARHGGPGAWRTCRSILASFAHWAAGHASLPGDEEVRDWIDEARDVISTAAQAVEATNREFAATLTAVLANRDEALFVQIGDSIAAVRTDSVWSVPLWPENGEYASTTFFVTDDPEPRVQLYRLRGHIDALALFSDGLEMVALDQQARAPHEPFLAPMIKPIETQTGSKRLVGLSEKLRFYLDSDRLAERTDDDKTLILAYRAA